MNRLFMAAVTAALLTGGIANAQTPANVEKQVANEEARKPNERILIETSMGNITVDLFVNEAPVSVANFLSYVDDEFYDGTIFHRVIDGFMIQGGGFTEDLKRKKTGDPIQNEANNGLSNKRGTLAMARMNPPHTATSQFFINVIDNAFLDYFNEDKYGYCVFGEVTDGMDVVDKMKLVKTGRKGPLPSDVPLETVTIIKVSRLD